VHLVRDSRGVAYSCQKLVEKHVTTGPPTYLPQLGPFEASVRYMPYNGLTASLRLFDAPYLLLRYEDLIDDPTRWLRAVAAHAGEDMMGDLPFLHDGQATVAENHMVDGKPVRFAKGGLKLRPDDEWRSKLSRPDQASVTVLTVPLLEAYGYPLRPQLRPGRR